MGKQIKKAIKKEKSRYFNEEIDFKHDSKASWKKVNDILGNQQNFSPGGILLQNSDGQNEYVSDPQRLSTEFNNYFRHKVNSMQQTTDRPPDINSSKRLETVWRVAIYQHPVLN